MTHTRPTAATSKDPLARMRVDEIATALVPQSFKDAEVLAGHPVTTEIAPQLYAAVCSIAVNIAEGYSRSSGKDRVRFYEYALGSVRREHEVVSGCGTGTRSRNGY